MGLSPSTNSTPWLSITLAGLTLVGTIASAGFAALSAIAGARATASLAMYEDQFTHSSTFSQRIHDSLSDLVIDENRGRLKGDRAATEVFSLFAIAEQPEEKRSLVYIALASHNGDLIDLFSQFLQQSTDPYEKELAKEFGDGVLRIYSTQVSNQTNHVAVDKRPDTSSQSYQAATARALGNATADNAGGWVYLGDSFASAPGGALINAYIDQSKVPAARNNVTFLYDVNLRDGSIAPRLGALPDVAGIITKGQMGQLKGGGRNPIFLPLAKRRFAVWALVRICPEAGC